MERRTPLDHVEFDDQYKIKQVVESNFGLVMKYLVENDQDFPHCCNHACYLFQAIIKNKTGFEIKICEGNRHDNSKNENCPHHVWLEYCDLIIDPTDFQFQAIDLWSLTLITENLILQNQSFNNLTKDEINNQFMNNYIEKAKQRYLNNPNEKEKHFLELKNMLKKSQIDPNHFVGELKENYGCQIFYSKYDQNFVYQQNHTFSGII